MMGMSPLLTPTGKDGDLNSAKIATISDRSTLAHCLSR
jgi:hypothetical protein